MIDLDKWCIPYARLQLFYGEGNRNNEIRHIRAIVDGHQIVYRTWSEKKQRWFYHIRDRCDLDFENEQGHLRRA